MEVEGATAIIPARVLNEEAPQAVPVIEEVEGAVAMGQDEIRNDDNAEGDEIRNGDNAEGVAPEREGLNDHNGEGAHPERHAAPEGNGNQRRSARTPKVTDRYADYRRSIAKQGNLLLYFLHSHNCQFFLCESPYLVTLFGLPVQSRENGKTMSKTIEPGSYKEAIACLESELWVQAIWEEYESLIKNGTWIVCQLPPGRKAIHGKWVLKLKPGFKSTPARYKARFVVKGYSQVEGIDYTETYAPGKIIA